MHTGQALFYSQAICVQHLMACFHRSATSSLPQPVSLPGGPLVPRHLTSVLSSVSCALSLFLSDMPLRKNDCGHVPFTVHSAFDTADTYAGGSELVNEGEAVRASMWEHVEQEDANQRQLEGVGHYQPTGNIEMNVFVSESVTAPRRSTEC